MIIFCNKNGNFIKYEYLDAEGSLLSLCGKWSGILFSIASKLLSILWETETHWVL